MMPKMISEEKRELTKRLILADEMTVRDIAIRAGVSVGTVTRMRSDMGLYSERNRTKPKPTRLGGQFPAKAVKDLGTNPNPSAAALRLAEFDPVVARAVIRRPAEDTEDGE